jgi:hypothetical protein
MSRLTGVTPSDYATMHHDCIIAFQGLSWQDLPGLRLPVIMMMPVVTVDCTDIMEMIWVQVENCYDVVALGVGWRVGST